MCGIVALLGKYEINTIITCLKQLQNRGYDSAGLSLLYYNKENFKIYKKLHKDSITKLEHITFQLGNESNESNNLIKNSISHTRWATHGGITENNCHPHISNNKQICLVHNGILENYNELKTMLINNGYSFYSDTDTEVIVNLIEFYIINNNYNKLEKAIEQALSKCEGTWGLVIQIINEPNVLYAVRKGSPLLLGKNKDYIIITSESSGFNNLVDSYIELTTHKVYKIDYNNIIKQNFINHELDKPIRKLSLNVTYDKGTFEHWTLKEIYDQNNIINKITNNGAILQKIDEFNKKVYFGGLSPNKTIINKCDNIILLGCGTSFNACCFAKSFFYELCNFNCIICIDACNFDYKDIPKNSTNAFIFVSQSGETKDLYEILQKVNGFKIGVINVVDSLIARSVNCGVYLNIGKEFSVASTKAFTAQSLILILIAISLSTDTNKINNYINDFQQLQNLINIELNRELFINENQLLKYKNGFVLGNNNLNIIGNEFSLKLKEITYMHIESLSFNSLKHGPLALVSENDFICILLGESESVKQEILARDGNIINLNINQNSNNLFNDILYIIQLQRLSYHLSVLKGYNPDFPRNLAKVVTV